jgi:hypothetical protein
LVKIYGNKNFIQVDQTKYSQDNFDSTVAQELKALADQNNKDTLDLISINTIEENIITYNNKIISENISEAYTTDNEQKLELLKEKDPSDYKLINDEIAQQSSIEKGDIYFLYSFAKLDNGIMSSRGWWRESCDVNDYQFFKNYTGPTIARDKNFILIKIN